MSLINVVIIAIGLSMDAFSLAILYGTLNFNIKKIMLLSSSVGMFHFFMPLIGNAFGQFIMSFVPIKSNEIVGIIFLFLSIEMIISLFKEEDAVDLKGFWSIILFAFTVSIDSFSVGIGLSAIYSNRFLAVLVFSVISFLFTFLGLLLGRFLSQKLGKASILIGSIVLSCLSFNYLFSYTC